MADHVEVRERYDGDWRVYYPDEAFIPCAPACALKHTHIFERGLVESYYRPIDLKDAVAWGKKIANEREVKVVKYAKQKMVPSKKKSKGNDSSK